MGKVLVRWRTHGALVEAGNAYSRAPGEEDEMPEPEAKALARSGVLRIVGASAPVVFEVEEDEG